MGRQHMPFKRQILTSGSVIALATVSCAGVALAQTDAAAGQANAVEQVVVTGSRIVTNGFQAPTPVTVVTAQQLIESKPLISEALNDLPSLQVGSQRTGGIGSGGSGQATVNMRNLGANRTLILLDGRRFIPTTADGTVDTSLMPNTLVQRVEIVTGGASAAYGADAVAGVVNYVLNKNFNGLKLNLEGGLSERGDVPEGQISVAAGGGFAGGRGHIIASGEYYISNGFNRTSRWFSQSGPNLITNPCPPGAAVSATCPTGPNGLARQLRVTDARLASGSTGGLITSGPLKGITFDDGGVARAFQYGTLTTANTTVGGEGSKFGNIGPNATLVGKLQRANAFTHITYDLTDKISVYAEGLIAESYNVDNSGYPYALGANAFTIKRDNAFLTQSIRDRMTALNLSTITVGRLLAEFPVYSPHTRTLTWRTVFGADAKLFGDWKGSFYYQHGYNRRPNVIPGQIDQIGLYDGVDAVVVPATGAPAGLVPGTIVCRSTLASPSHACTPINILGVNAASQTMIDSVTTNHLEWNKQVLTQDVGSFSATGTLFNDWAGPVSGAVGIDLRKESLNFTSDPWSQVANPVTNSFGGYRAGNALPYSGSVNVKEYYGEVQVPLADNLPFAYRAEVNAAGRITDYSTSGTVDTWKLGAIYSPIQDLKFRGTISRDIRAPSLSELFQTGAAGQATLTDPFNNTQTPAVKTITRGNPDLKPETAKTYVFGLVFQPHWFQGFSISVDHFNIKIAGAIATVAAQDVLNQCFADRSSSLCNFIVRNSAGTLTAIDNRPFNYSFARTVGTDFEVDYRLPIGDSFPLVGGGTLTTRFLGTHYETVSSQAPGAAVNENAGEVGTPKDRALLSFTLAKGNWSYFLQSRYWGPVVQDVTYVQGVDIDRNHTGSVMYFDARIAHTFDIGAHQQAQLSLSVNNLLDRQPPFIPSGGSAPSYSTQDYDQVGRYYRVGLNMSF